MRKTLISLLTVVACMFAPQLAAAQNAQPQTNYPAQLQAANPSVYLTFNNPSLPFRENVTGAQFLSGYGPSLGTFAVLQNSLSTGSVVFESVPAPSTLALTTLYLQFLIAPTSPCTIFIGQPASPGSLSITPSDTFTVTPAATTGLQQFQAGTAFTARNVPSGAYVGVSSTSTCRPTFSNPVNGVNYYSYAGTGAVGTAQTYTSAALTPGVSALLGTAPVITNVVGFDSTQTNNTAASIPFNSYIYAPSSTTGDFEWSSPFSVVFQIDNLNWARSGTKILQSKQGANGAGYLLDIYMATATVANFCVVRTSKGELVSPNSTQETTCTAIGVDVLNGFNYNVIYGNDGTGFPGASSNFLTVNGVGGTNRYLNSGSTFALGGVSVTLNTTSATGYAAATPVNAVGGGSNCFVFFNLPATSGVPTAPTLLYTKNYGCTSVPSLTPAPINVSLTAAGSGYGASGTFTNTAVTNCAAGLINGTWAATSGALTSIAVTSDSNSCTAVPPITLTGAGTGATITAAATTGTGATITAVLVGGSMSNTGALYIAGSNNGLVTNGSDAVPTDSPLVVDTFAIFPSVLSTTQIDSIFYQTKWYQPLMNPTPSTPYLLIYDNDGSADADDVWALASTIAAERLGYITLAAVASTTNDGTGFALYRQMLDQAGLAHVPLCRPSSFAISIGTSVSASAAVYNASTSQTPTSYPLCTSVYRQIFASNPTRPVYIMLAGTFRAVADWMGSAADSISTLTGAQQVAQNAANGGALYLQGGNQPPYTYSTGGDNSFLDWTAGQYVFAHHGNMNIYMFGGSPQVSGPGPLATRNNKDPLYTYAVAYGSDQRNAYDSLPTLNFISSKFGMPVTGSITAAGTGYATTTTFNISASGYPQCVGSFTVTSVSGALTTINYDNPTYPTYFGVGRGCPYGSTPVATAVNPTGTGGSITLTPTTTCGTVAITSGSAGTISTACDHVYLVNPTIYTSTGYPTIMTWMLNSLNDPPANGTPRAQ
jgi:hypothetical protein